VLLLYVGWGVETLLARRCDLARLRAFWALTKLRQTALLLVTGICSYTLTRGLPLDPLQTPWMSTALFLAISGCTVLNMVLDRDIDTVMERSSAQRSRYSDWL